MQNFFGQACVSGLSHSHDREWKSMDQKGFKSDSSDHKTSNRSRDDIHLSVHSHGTLSLLACRFLQHRIKSSKPYNFYFYMQKRSYFLNSGPIRRPQRRGKRCKLLLTLAIWHGSSALHLKARLKKTLFLLFLDAKMHFAFYISKVKYAYSQN